jgi:hypothetical protein
VERWVEGLVRLSMDEYGYVWDIYVNMLLNYSYVWGNIVKIK